MVFIQSNNYAKIVKYVLQNQIHVNIIYLKLLNHRKQFLKLFEHNNLAFELLKLFIQQIALRTINPKA